MLKLGIFSSYLIFLLLSISCVKAQSVEEVLIGNQTWMTKNLDNDVFMNGDIVPEVKSEQEWKMAYENKKPAWCYYDFNSSNGKKYGKLYNIFAIMDERKISPTGWHVANKIEWMELLDYFGGIEIATRKLKKQNEFKKEEIPIFSSALFNNFPIELSLTNNDSSIFSLVPGGYANYSGSSFYYMGSNGYWWVANGINSINWVSVISFNNEDNCWFESSLCKSCGYSIRCVKNK
jgi:uncharacterized protein (TIGR02145 family)